MWRDKTVLIIDDETTTVFSLFTLVEDLSKIIFAKSLVAAVELIAQRAPDLILLDHKLPDGTGLDLLSYLKELNMNIPIIVITSQYEAEYEYTQMGACAFVRKPFDTASTKALIKSELQRISGWKACGSR